jgi:hypothetical protein
VDSLALDGAGVGIGCFSLRLSINMFEGGTGCHHWEAGYALAGGALRLAA